MIDTAMLLRDLDLTFGAVMLNWVLGALSVEELAPAAAYGYALTLRGAATPAWQDHLADKIGDYQRQLLKLRRCAACAAPANIENMAPPADLENMVPPA